MVKRIKRSLYAAEYGEQLESGEVFGELEDRGEYQEEQGGTYDHHNEGVMKDKAMADPEKDQKWTYTQSFILGVYDQAIMTRLKTLNEERLMSVVYSALKTAAPHRGPLIPCNGSEHLKSWKVVISRLLFMQRILATWSFLRKM